MLSRRGKEDLFADETKQIDGTVTTSGREDPFQNSADEDPKRNKEGLALRTPNIEKKEEDNHDQILDDFRQFFAGIENSNIPARVMTKYDHLNGSVEIICECSGCYLGHGCHMQWYYQPEYYWEAHCMFRRDWERKQKMRHKNLDKKEREEEEKRQEGK